VVIAAKMFLVFLLEYLSSLIWDNRIGKLVDSSAFVWLLLKVTGEHQKYSIMSSMHLLFRLECFWWRVVFNPFCIMEN